MEEVQELVANNTPEGEISENVTLYFSDNGVSKIKLEAPILQKVVQPQSSEEESQSDLICPQGMLVTFYDSLGKPESELYANYGKLLTNEQYLLVKDSVVFTNPKKDKLETELLHIFFDKDSIVTPEIVKITTKDGVIEGKGMTANTNFTKYRLNAITNSYYNLKENKEE